VILAVGLVLLPLATPAGSVRLPVPAVAQAPERCGPAAVSMVLHYYGADSVASGLGGCGYDPILRGTLITDLARCAQEAGFAASVERPGADSLQILLSEGVPPVLLYERGVGPLTRLHYGVLIGWEPSRDAFVINDGRRKPIRMKRGALLSRWRSAGGRALIVRPLEP